MHMKKTILLWAALLSAIGFSAFAQETQKPEYGYKVSDFVSKPKFGAYIIGGYKYSDQEGAHGGPGFNCRLIRMYVDGSIFDDFKYRIQFQANGTSPHVKDFYVEWAKYKEFSVKMGQFKRAFTFENPMNPWDVGVGDYSFLVQKMSGMGDRLGEANMGGRDQGIQVQGDLIPMAMTSTACSTTSWACTTARVSIWPMPTSPRTSSAPSRSSRSRACISALSAGRATG